MIDNIILYALGIFLMAGMSGWGRPVIIVLIALLYVSVSDLMSKEMLRYMEMGAFIVMAIAMPDHALMLFLPLLVYDCVRMRSWKAGVITGIGGLMQCVWLAQGEMELFRFLLWCFALILAAILSVRTKRSLRLAQEVIHLKDSSTELRLVMQKRQQDLLEKQDTEVYLATLKERNRIAREIHDNVGHMLTRSILQVGAIQTINKEPILANPLSDLRATLDTAMNSIRSSVHDLHDESIDTKAAIQDMLNDITGFHTSFEYDMGNIVPKDIKYCLISIAKEAITNAVKHSNGDQLSILIREHPGFYQLTIRDNGTGIHLTTSPGIGLTNIQERVQSLSGTLQISTESGFRLFVSIPKYTQKGDRTA